MMEDEEIRIELKKIRKEIKEVNKKFYQTLYESDQLTKEMLRMM